MSIVKYQNVEAYVAAPQGQASTKAIVLLSEWWGLNEQIKKLSDRFAAQGFVVATPDLYHGKVAKDANEANHLMSGLDFKAAVKEAGIWIQYLKQEKKCKKVGVTGFCMGNQCILLSYISNLMLGGALTLASASGLGAEVNAISVFYGIPDLTVFPPSAITCPILLNFGKRDDLKGFSDSTAVKKLTDELKKHEKIYQLDWYDAGHAFMNEMRPEAYKEAAAKEAFSETVNFFSQHLA